MHIHTHTQILYIKNEKANRRKGTRKWKSDCGKIVVARSYNKRAWRKGKRKRGRRKDDDEERG